MRTHSQVVAAAGVDRIAALRGVSMHTARSWIQRDSIPAEHWSALVRERLATLDELAEAAAAKPRSRPFNSQVAA